MLLCLFTLSGLKCGNDSTGSRCRGGGADYNVEKSSCCMLIWSGKNYGHGQGKSGNLILHKEWEPCCDACAALLSKQFLNVLAV